MKSHGLQSMSFCRRQPRKKTRHRKTRHIRTDLGEDAMLHPTNSHLPGLKTTPRTGEPLQGHREALPEALVRKRSETMRCGGIHHATNGS